MAFQYINAFHHIYYTTLVMAHYINVQNKYSTGVAFTKQLMLLTKICNSNL